MNTRTTPPTSVLFKKLKKKLLKKPSRKDKLRKIFLDGVSSGYNTSNNPFYYTEEGRESLWDMYYTKHLKPNKGKNKS